MEYLNLIEDEKEASKERLYMRFAILAILMGGLFLWMRFGKKRE